MKESGTAHAPQKAADKRKEAREIAQVAEEFIKELKPREHVVKIVMERGRHDAPPRMRAVPEVVRLDWRRGDTIKWETDHDAAYVQFEQSPFEKYAYLVSRRFPARTKHVDRERLAQLHKTAFAYTVGDLTGEARPQDPVVIFEPDPGGQG